MRKDVRALFLDRDGVINEDYGYVHKISDFKFRDGIFDLCKVALDLGYILVIVTNQSGIGRGLYTELDFLELSKWMISQFERNFIKISRIYHCPFHPKFGIGRYKRQSDLRKPSPGMLLQAATDFNINLSSSIIIGDQLTDMEAGITANLGYLLLLNSSIDTSDLLKYSRKIHIKSNLFEAKDMVIEIQNQESKNPQ